MPADKSATSTTHSIFTIFTISIQNLQPTNFDLFRFGWRLSFYCAFFLSFCFASVQFQLWLIVTIEKLSILLLIFSSINTNSQFFFEHKQRHKHSDRRKSARLHGTYTRKSNKIEKIKQIRQIRQIKLKRILFVVSCTCSLSLSMHIIFHWILAFATNLLNIFSLLLVFIAMENCENGARVPTYRVYVIYSNTVCR